MIYVIGKYRISAMPSGSSYIPVQKSAYPVLLALFTTIFVLSNIVSTKGVQVGPLVTDGAFFLFPAAYVIGDVISECYGFRAARRAVWTGFLAMIIAVSTFYVAILLPAASFYEGQAAFAVTLGLVPRIVVASLSGYAAGRAGFMEAAVGVDCGGRVWRHADFLPDRRAGYRNFYGWRYGELCGGGVCVEDAG